MTTTQHATGRREVNTSATALATTPAERARRVPASKEQPAAAAQEEGGSGAPLQISNKELARRMGNYLLGGRPSAAVSRASEVGGATQETSSCPMIPLESHSRADRGPLLSFDYDPVLQCLVPFRPNHAKLQSQQQITCTTSAEDVAEQQQQNQQPNCSPSDGVCPYLSAAIPPVPIDKYIQRALDYCHASPNCGILALILLLRLTHSGPALDPSSPTNTNIATGNTLASPATSFPADPSFTTTEAAPTDGETDEEKLEEGEDAESDEEEEDEESVASPTAIELNTLVAGQETSLSIPLSLWTFHRVFFACFILAIKWLEDKTYVMGYYASVGGFPTSKELCGLEKETFRRLGFSLLPSREEWTAACDVLGVDVPPTEYNPVSALSAHGPVVTDSNRSSSSCETPFSPPVPIAGCGYSSVVTSSDQSQSEVPKDSSFASTGSGYDGGSEVGATLANSSIGTDLGSSQEPHRCTTWAESTAASC